MKLGFTLFLRLIILLTATGVLAGMIRFPQTEGRAVDLDLISIYKDPFIIYLYIASIPFFVALFQAFKLAGYIDKKKIFSPAAIEAVWKIKYCALILSVFLVMAIFYIRVMANGDDAAGPTMLGFIAITTSVGIAIAANVFQKRLQQAAHGKA